VSISCDFSGLEITYQAVIVKGNTLIIKDIVALGSLASSLGKVTYCCSFQLTVTYIVISVCSDDRL